MSGDQTTATVLAALQTLYHDSNPAHKKSANDYLEEFQHSVSAWQTCHSLLTAPESPPEARLFAAQTFRAKIIYDIDQLPMEQRLPLRDSFISALIPLCQPSAPQGSRAIRFQLCLSISGLGLQTGAWATPVTDMIEQFGKDPATVDVLLLFLKAWVEESMNPRIPLVDGQARVSAVVDQVIGVLSMYIQAPGITPPIQEHIFQCLSSWMQAGEVMASAVAQTPLFTAAFDALASDELFDPAVDTICDLIHETQEIQDNVALIQQIVPRLVALRPQMEVHRDDPERIRGYCRLFCEAGECYKDLIVQHPTDLLPLVQAVAACAAYPDLEIVPITFNFWYCLASSLGRHPADPNVRPILDIFEQVQTIIIGHLHFPADNETQTAQERDEFRSFRHRMGDTLKDCCHVLGAPACLRKSYDLVVAEMAKGSPSWQEIEAPLFSMRSMGAEVDPDDDEIMPHIMELLPKLPDHPRIRYAAILVLSRYTQWIDRHPENLSFQLQYISAGFDMAEDEVSAAAAQAMKFMCQDCSQHLVPFLPQLHSFVATVGNKLDQSDMVEVCEAIGYVISGMPAEEAAPALRQFCEPLIETVATVAKSDVEASKPDLQKVADALEQIDSFLTIIRTLDPVPETCFPFASAVYSVLDVLVQRYAKYYFMSERIGSLIRRGLGFFPARALEPLVRPVLERMARAFEETGYASYIWIIGKVAAKFGDAARGPGGEALAQVLGETFSTISQSLARLLQTKPSHQIPDVMDDYAHCFMAFLTHLSPLTISSPSIPTATVLTISALSCPLPETTLISLDTLALLAQRASHAQFQPILQPVFADAGKVLLTTCLRGVVSDFPEDGLEAVQTIVNAAVSSTSADIAEKWVAEALSEIPGNALPPHEKEAFLSELREFLVAPGSDRLKNALFTLVRAARRARERGRDARKSMGGV